MSKSPITVATTVLAMLATSTWATSQSAERAAPRNLPGLAVATKQVVMSTPIEGMLVSVLVDEGQPVERGQPLAQLDDRVARAAVNAARVAYEQRADIDHAQASVALAEEKLARLERAGDAVNALTLAEASAHAAQARASLDSAHHARRQAQRNLELEQARLERLTIRAPFAGRVTRVLAREGTTMTTAHELMRLVALAELRADVPVPIAEFGKLEVGRSYRLTAGAPVSRTLSARLAFIDPVLDAASGTFRCSFRIDNSAGQLPAGFAVRIASLVPMPTEAQPAPPSDGR